MTESPQEKDRTAFGSCALDGLAKDHTTMNTTDSHAQTVAHITDYAEKLHAGITLERSVIVARIDDALFAIAHTEARGAGTKKHVLIHNVLFLGEQELRATNELVCVVFALVPNARFVIWTESFHSRAVAQEFTCIPPVLDDLAQIVGVKALVLDVLNKTRLQKALAKSAGCLIKSGSEGMGSIAAGESISRTATTALVLEKSARVFKDAQYLGGAQPINRIEAKLMHLVFKKKYSRIESRVTHQTSEDFSREIPPEEMELRQEIVEAGRQLLARNLVQGTWGNISVQLDDRFMLVTPTGLEYDLLSPYDIVRVDMHSMEYEGSLRPTSEKLIHATLLKEKLDVRSVIHTHPVSGSIYAAARSSLKVADENSRKLMGGNVTVARYALPGSKRLASTVLDAIQENKSCIMENHGVLVCGASLSDALEKCALLEQLAEAQIQRIAPEKL